MPVWSSLGHNEHKFDFYWFVHLCTDSVMDSCRNTLQWTRFIFTFWKRTRWKREYAYWLGNRPPDFLLLLELCPWNETSWQSSKDLISLNGGFCPVSEPKMKQLNSLLSSPCQVGQGGSESTRGGLSCCGLQSTSTPPQLALFQPCFHRLLHFLLHVVHFLLGCAAK